MPPPDEIPHTGDWITPSCVSGGFTDGSTDGVAGTLQIYLQIAYFANPLFLMFSFPFSLFLLSSFPYHPRCPTREECIALLSFNFPGHCSYLLIELCRQQGRSMFFIKKSAPRPHTRTTTAAAAATSRHICRLIPLPLWCPSNDNDICIPSVDTTTPHLPPLYTLLRHHLGQPQPADLVRQQQVEVSLGQPRRLQDRLVVSLGRLLHR